MKRITLLLVRVAAVALLAFLLGGALGLSLLSFNDNPAPVPVTYHL